jgi:hypothetical protein
MKLEKTSKTFKFLKEVHQETMFPKEISMSTIIRKHKLSPTAFKVLVDNKLVTFEGTHKKRVYKWNTILPNVKMAEEFYSRYQDSVKESNSKRLTTPKEQVTTALEMLTPMEQEVEIQKVKRKYTKRTPKAIQVTKTREFSLAWGLIKFNY